MALLARPADLHLSLSYGCSLRQSEYLMTAGKSGMHRPKMHSTLTIVIPTYNRALPLQKCLESILSQNMQQIPVLVLDNSSDLPVADIVAHCAQVAAADNVRVVRNALNIGLYGNI